MCFKINMEVGKKNFYTFFELKFGTKAVTSGFDVRELDF